jgi:hypothetical protein
MTTDRELLEMAARAAGFYSRDAWAFDPEWGLKISSGPPPYEWWNPSSDEGDAARLAMRLCAAGKMRIQITEQSITCFYEQDGVFVPWSWGYETCTLSEAFCKCITGAAAEIGRAMP